MIADLHLHTYISDSTRSPEQVAALARKEGIGLISVCDHDTIAAYARLAPACTREGVRLIQGAELSALWGAYSLHVLGLGFDPENRGVLELIRHNQREHERFDEALILNLERDFPMLGMDDYRRFERTPERGGWKNTNYIAARNLARDVTDGYRYFEQYATYKSQFATLSDVCKLVMAAGGAPVLAHPGNWWADLPDDFEQILSDLMADGIRGIECYYPSHTREMTRRCTEFCKQNGLNITAGSDDHGDFNKTVDGVTYEMGAVMVDEHELDLRGIV